MKNIPVILSPVGGFDQLMADEQEYGGAEAAIEAFVPKCVGCPLKRRAKLLSGTLLKHQGTYIGNLEWI